MDIEAKSWLHLPSRIERYHDLVKSRVLANSKTEI